MGAKVIDLKKDKRMILDEKPEPIVFADAALFFHTVVESGNSSLLDILLPWRKQRLDYMSPISESARIRLQKYWYERGIASKITMVFPNNAKRIDMERARLFVPELFNAGIRECDLSERLWGVLLVSRLELLGIITNVPIQVPFNTIKYTGRINGLCALESILRRL